MEKTNTGTVVTVKMPVSRWLKADERLAEAIKELEKDIERKMKLIVDKTLLMWVPGGATRPGNSSSQWFSFEVI
ncbi:MAG: hypothetical protein PHD82_07270 [Candidatus Riflebacteria bacterium]|nr:hypothetical protein [Candidatus Riflebacteria bacterium]